MWLFADAARPDKRGITGEVPGCHWNVQSWKVGNCCVYVTGTCELSNQVAALIPGLGQCYHLVLSLRDPRQLPITELEFVAQSWEVHNR